MPPTEAAKRKAPEELGSSGASGWVVAFASRNIVCVMCFQQRGDCKIPLLRHFCQSGRNPLALRLPRWQLMHQFGPQFFDQLAHRIGNGLDALEHAGAGLL
jgi:hypothetical protein